MDELSRSVCDSVSVDVDPTAVFGFPGPGSIRIEAPANIRQGVYDIDLVGAFSYLGGRETFMRHVGSIGRFCSIASNVVAGQIEHPTDFLSAHPLFEGAFAWKQLEPFRTANAEMIEKASAEFGSRLSDRNRKILIGHDVWIGEGAFIRRGVRIGDGAIVASRAVVTKDVPPFAIVGGAPCRLIRMRFEPEIVSELMRLAWWDYGLSALNGVDFTNIETAVTVLDHNIKSGQAERYTPEIIEITADRTAHLIR